MKTLLKDLFGAFCGVSALIDLEWMLIAPRFNPWYYTVDYWEFCPFLKVNWWIAYATVPLRLIIGIGYYARRLR